MDFDEWVSTVGYIVVVVCTVVNTICTVRDKCLRADSYFDRSEEIACCPSLNLQKSIKWIPVTSGGSSPLDVSPQKESVCVYGQSLMMPCHRPTNGLSPANMSDGEKRVLNALALPAA